MILPQETRKISKKQPNPTTKATRGRRANITQSWLKERNHKGEELNERQKIINEMKSWLFEKVTKLIKL